MDGAPGRKVVVITGCSTGIGHASAAAFVAAGWITVATARQVETLVDLAAAGCEVATLDVTNESQCASVVGGVLERHGRIDVLVNNAGYPEYGPLEEVALDRWRAQFETNVIALVSLTQKVLPAMREAGHGRIINVSSMGGIITLPLGAAYHASKWAVEALSDVARFELSPFGIDVVVIEPGVVLTNFSEPAMVGLNVSPDSVYFGLATKFAALVAASYAKKSMTNITADRVGAAIVRASTVRRPKTRYVLPLQARGLILLRRLVPDRVYDLIQRSQVR